MPLAILLIRTYAFFNRNTYILIFLITSMAGVAAYQLYVDTTQMLCTLHLARCNRDADSLFFSATLHRPGSSIKLYLGTLYSTTTQDHGPCLPMSKPHSAHLLGKLDINRAAVVLICVAGFFVSISPKRRTTLSSFFPRSPPWDSTLWLPS